jgi:3-deoxy-D-manno-octulosonic acid kinase
MTSQVTKINQSIILYDDRLMNEIDENIFETDFWKMDKEAQPQSMGRGTVYFVKIQDQPCVLRHYNRGGLVAKLTLDKYLWIGEHNTRSFKEWRLLNDMVKKRLPVPAPVAARYVRNGIYYKADIITREIPDIESLSDKLLGNSMTEKLWENIGECIAKFHCHGFFHMDLNVENIQIDQNNQVFLLDFDKGKVSEPLGRLSDLNLMRLRRSIAKVTQLKQLAFPSSGWDKCITKYKGKF